MNFSHAGRRLSAQDSKRNCGFQRKPPTTYNVEPQNQTDFYLKVKRRIPVSESIRLRTLRQVFRTGTSTSPKASSFRRIRVLIRSYKMENKQTKRTLLCFEKHPSHRNNRDNCIFSLHSSSISSEPKPGSDQSIVIHQSRHSSK